MAAMKISALPLGVVSADSKPVVPMSLPTAMESSESWGSGCTSQALHGRDYGNLFNLEPLLSYQIPIDDNFPSCPDVSIDGMKDEVRLLDYMTSEKAERPLSSQPEMTLKRKRVQIEAEAGSNACHRDGDEYNNDIEDIQISEEQYRCLLGEHLDKRRKAYLKDAIASRLTAKQPFYEAKSASCLDLGGGLIFQIPPFYDELAASLNLPDSASIEIDESILSGQLNSRDLMTVISSDPRARIWGLGELGSGFASKSYEQQKQGISGDMYPLQVFDAASVEPVLSPMHEDDAEVMQEVHFENKILERGDGYEVIQRRIPKRDSIRRNPDTMAREDGEKISKCWSNLVRKDLPRHFKHFMTYQKKQKEMKKFADFCQREVKSRNMRLVKMMKAAALRTRKQLSRDMVIFWKRIDKEQAEIKKREEKDAADALKREEEMREARRQQQRLNFLLTQTELYSHFMQNKQASQNKSALQAGSEQSTVLLDSNAPLDAIEAAELEALKEQALQAAKMAASEQQDIINMFDEECLRLRQDDGPTEDPGNDIDLLNPSTMPTSSSVQQPRLFHGILKEYQLKGLQWLVNCYEQGLNGILADEMGLGKTIQAMAFLAHLAEDKNIWGPFLVVAPASVLSNWADEVNRFCPQLKILPYWGGLQERAVLRKNINPKRLYRREASFHILITSYQLLVSDEKYFKRVKWQYMVLDEAQAIKSANSVRWKTLLSFNCRNRLLLTGTPIQNNMAELWALLHFIMPTLFDSHEQFNEWFSKGIESHAEHGGTLNEHQLTRLHAILKPFMLRRVKKDVITELSNKTEVVVPCFLSSRQEAIYQAIKNKISLSDLFDGSHMNDLMNIVIQLRKVCNHPELFERNEGHAFFHFAQFSNSLLPPPFGELEDIHFAGSHNPITCKIPRLVYRNGMECLPTWCSGSPQGFQEKWLGNLLNVYSSHNVYDSVFPSHDGCGIDNGVSSGTFGFTRLLGLSPSEVAYMAKSSYLERWLFDLEQSERASINTMTQLFTDEIGEEKTRAVTRLLVSSKSASSILSEKLPAGLPCAPFEALITTVREKFLASIRVLRAVYAFIPPVSAPQIEVVCSDRSFAYQRLEELHNPWVKKMLVGFSRTSEYNGPSIPPTCDMVEERCRKVQQPLLAIPFRVFGSALPLQSFDFAKTLTDSGKLQALDRLLRRLRAENHRVLVFAQMTKMLDILEDYMNYRKYRYLRLDGSSTIMDRRDMVKDFQHRSDIFVFLLSTRAGGLGINLTAADTVIFYESDWNPTMDLQAMDRAHRLGQTKEVTVYRLICKGTVEEKIVKRANQKNTVQQLVMTGNQSQDVFEADEVVSLLLDDAELEQKLKRQSTDQQSKRKKGWGMSGGLKAIQMDAEGGLCITEIPNDVNGGFVEGELQPGTGKAAAVENGGSKRKASRKRQSTEGRPPKPTKANKMAKEKNAPRESQKQGVLKDVQPKKEIASRTPRKRGKGKNDTTLNGTLDTSNGS